jgi:hypothetical protein
MRKTASNKKAAEKASKREASLQAQIDREASHIKSLEELIANLKQQLVLSQPIAPQPVKDESAVSDTPVESEAVDAAPVESVPTVEAEVVETEVAPATATE